MTDNHSARPERRRPERVDVKLDLAERRARALGLVISLIALGLLVAGIVTLAYLLLSLFLRLWDESPTGPVTADNLFALGSCLLALLGMGLLRFQQLIVDRLVPTWVFEERDEVILVWGSVSGTSYDRVFREMLTRRPGYGHHPTPHETYGASLAAVPAGPGYVQPAEPFLQVLAEQLGVETTELDRRKPM